MTARSWFIVTLLACATLLVPVTGTAAPRASAPAQPAVCLPSATFTEPLTIDEAVSYALRNNPAIRNAEQNVDIAKAEVDIAEANGRPNLNLGATGTYIPSPTSTTFEGNQVQLSQQFSATAALTASQPVWPSARWRAPVRSARAGVGASQQALTRTREQIAFQTRQAFFELLSAQELLLVAQDAVSVARRQVSLATSTVNAGLAAPLDIYQAQAALANAEVAQVRARNAVDIARSGLAITLGVPAGTSLEVTPTATLPTAPASPDDLVTCALANRADLAELNYRRAQLRAAIDLIRVQRQPNIDLAATYSQPLAGAGIFSSEGLSITANIAWNLYNGGRTRAQVEQTRLQLAQIDTNATQLALGITQEVRQAWLNLRNAIEQLSAAQRQLDAATEALRIAQIRYENGEGIELEVEQARLQRTQALTSLTQARFQAQVAAAQLDFALGVEPTATAVTITPAPPISTTPAPSIGTPAPPRAAD